MLLPRQSPGRAPDSEAFILAESRRHAQRLGKAAIDASNIGWKHDEAERTARHASGAARREAFARLAALNASYGVAAVTLPGSRRAARVRAALGAAGTTLASGAIAGLALFGILSLPTLFDGGAHPLRAFPTETKTADIPPLWPLVVEGFACSAILREAIRRDANRAPRALLIHPVWRH